MGTSKENARDEISSQGSQLRQDHTDIRGNELDAVGGESCLSTMAEQVEKTVDAESKKQISAPDQKGAMPTTSCEEALVAVNSVKKEQQSEKPESQSDQSLVTHVPGVSSQKTESLPDKMGSPVSITRTPDVPQQTQSADSRTPTSESCKGGSVITAKYEMSSDTLPQIQSPNATSLLSQSNQLALAYSGGPEKYLDKLQPRRNPDTIVQLSQSAQGSVSSLTPEKPSEDGYNWRKYGQKLVKGNEFVRSYYKCTYLNCLAKKQVERSNAGHIIDINYLGNHEHPKPQQVPQIGVTLVQPIQARRPDSPIMSIPEADKPSAACVETSKPEPVEANLPLAIVPSEAVGGSTRDDIGNTSSRDAKKQKRDISAPDDPMLNKHYSEARHVVQTRSEVDLVNDGYRWRKYGQKLVKGNPNPRSYYRCSSTGCPVKKHVERASHDPKLVITTYEGQHVHDMPGSRSVSQKASESDGKIAAMNGDTRSEPGESKPNGLDMVIHIGAN